MTQGPDLIGPLPDMLGYCPHCAVPVPAEFLLIEYDRRDERTCYAECPACRDVVRPAGGVEGV